MKHKTITASELLANIAITGLQEKKGVKIVRMDLRNVNGAVTDYFVICSGTSDRHVQALGDSVEDTVRKELKEKPISREGRTAGEWILLDYVNVVVHIFQQEKRDFYNIEELWGDAEFASFD